MEFGIDKRIIRTLEIPDEISISHVTAKATRLDNGSVAYVCQLPDTYLTTMKVIVYDDGLIRGFIDDVLIIERDMETFSLDVEVVAMRLGRHYELKLAKKRSF